MELIERARNVYLMWMKDNSLGDTLASKEKLYLIPAIAGEMQRYGDERAAAAREAAIEEAAQIIKGIPHKEHYRQWPAITGIGEGSGSQNNTSDVTIWCDVLADTIRFLAAKPRE